MNNRDKKLRALKKIGNDARRKIDTEKAFVLRHKHGLNDSQIATYLGCSKAGVHSALKRFSKLMLKPGELESYRENKGSILDSLEARMLIELTDPDKMQKATLGNVAYAAGQVANMNRLEKGLTTSNVAYVDMTATLEELRQQKAQLVEALDAL